MSTLVRLSIYPNQKNQIIKTQVLLKLAPLDIFLDIYYLLANIMWICFGAD